VVAIRAERAVTLKLAIIALALLLVAGMIGRSLAPRVGRPKPGRAVEAARKCSSCGAYALARCDRSDCPLV
jgi:hypothetical protein